MATEVVEVIAESGGAFTSVVAWEAALPANLVTADEIRIGQLERNTVENPTIAGSTVDATRYIVLRGNYDLRHRGRHLGAQATIYGGVIVSGVGFTRLQDLALFDLTPGVNDGAIHVSVSTGACQVTRCVVWSDIGFKVEGSSDVHFESCVMWRCSAYGFRDLGTGTYTMDNCLAFEGRDGYEANTGAHVLTNCIGFGNSNPDFSAGFTQVNCAASDATAAGTLPLDNLTDAQWARAARANPDLAFFWNGDEETGDLLGKLGRAMVMRKAGALLGTLNGTATISGGKLTCDASGESLDFTSPAGQCPGVTGAIVFPWTPNYAGTPSLSTLPFRFKPNSANNNNLLDVYHSSSDGKLRIEIADNAASLTTFASASAWVPVSGRKYIFSLTWDGWDGGAGTGDATLVVYDTVAETYSTEVAGTGATKTRDETDTDGAIYLGNNDAASRPCEGDIDFFEVYDKTSPAFRGDLTGEAWATADLPLYDDALGALDDFALTERSIQELKWEGATSGAAESIEGDPVGSRPMRGAHTGRRQPRTSAAMV